MDDRLKQTISDALGIEPLPFETRNVVHSYPLNEGEKPWRHVVQSLGGNIVHQSEGFDEYEANILKDHDIEPRARFNPVNGDCLGIDFVAIPNPVKREG